jgi:HEAT repeat protein
VDVEQEHRRFAAHLLGFVELDGYDGPLGDAAAGGRAWKEGEQGLALTALGRRRSADGRILAWRLLYDHEAHKEVRRSAAIALGLMLDPGETDELKRLARFVRDGKRDSVAQHFAVMALANVGGDTAVDLVEDLLASNVLNTDDDRAFLHLALGILGERSPKAREILMGVYERERSRGNWAVQALALGLARHEPAVKLTMERLEKHGFSSGGGDGPDWGGPAAPGTGRGSGGGDESKDFNSWACLALGLHGDGRAVPLLQDMFRKRAIPALRGRAAIALTLIQRNAAVPELVEILKRSGTMHQKAAVVLALSLLPEPSRAAFDALKAAYLDDSLQNEVRAMAVAALGAMGDPRPVPLSALLTRHYNYFIRCLALDEIASFL